MNDQGVGKVRAFNPTPMAGSFLQPAPFLGWGEEEKNRICELRSQILFFSSSPRHKIGAGTGTGEAPRHGGGVDSSDFNTTLPSTYFLLVFFICCAIIIVRILY